MSAERERLVKAVEEADNALDSALQSERWLSLRRQRNEYERARAALAAYDAAHKEDK